MNRVSDDGVPQVRKESRDELLRKRREELLDEALEETFPASDPPSIARPLIGKAKS